MLRVYRIARQSNSTNSTTSPIDSRHWFRFQRELFPWLEEALGLLDVPTSWGLVERLRTEGLLRRLCGWEATGAVPSEGTFSRAFAEFAASDLPGRLHEALLDRTLEGHLAGHVSRDSTAIPGGESPAPKPAPTAKPKRRRSRPRKDEPRAKEPRRLQRQAAMTLEGRPRSLQN